MAAVSWTSLVWASEVKTPSVLLYQKGNLALSWAEASLADVARQTTI